MSVWCKHGVNTDRLICTQCRREATGNKFDYAPFKPPFKYDPDDQCIFDSAGNMIVDMRGWGFLTGKGAMAYDSEKAMKIQDKIGERITHIINKDLFLK